MYDGTDWKAGAREDFNRADLLKHAGETLFQQRGLSSKLSSAKKAVNAAPASLKAETVHFADDAAYEAFAEMHSPTMQQATCTMAEAALLQILKSSSDAKTKTVKIAAQLDILVSEKVAHTKLVKPLYEECQAAMRA